MNKQKLSFLLAALAALAIVLVGALLYAPSLAYQLTFLDDNAWINDYHWYLKNPSNISVIFTQPDLITGIFYRPILNLSFMANAIWGGTSLWVYHLTNILIHVFNGYLVFILFRKLKYSFDLSLLCALIFIVHPVLTSAVAWIPGRTDSLLGTFVLISFICFLNFIETKNILSLAGHLIFFLLGCLTKETAIVLPVICFLYIYLISQGKGSSKRIYFLSAAGVTLAWLGVRSLILSKSQHTDLWLALKSVVENSPGIISYLGKIYLPVNLSVLPILKDTTLVYGLITIALLLTVIVLSKVKRIRFIIFGICWFVLFLLPSMVFSFLNHEYRLYLPILGCFILTLEMDWVKNFEHDKKGGWIIAAIVIALLFFSSVHHSQQYKDRFTFWEDAVKTSPHSPLAHRNLGAMYHLEKILDKAEEQYKQALALNPYEQMVHNNLGLIYVSRQQLQAGEAEYKQEIAINPTYDNVYYNLGLLYWQEGRLDEVPVQWKKTIELNPKYIDAYKQLAVFYYNQKNLKETAYYVDQLQHRGIEVPHQILQGLGIH